MNIKALFVVIAVAFLVLFGYNYYSGKKREQVIKEMRAETERVTAENARLDAENAKKATYAQIEAMPNEAAKKVLIERELSKKPTQQSSAPISTTQNAEQAQQLKVIYARWKDGDEIAVRSSRIALSTPVKNLQDIKREAQALKVTDCLAPYQAKLVGGMDEALKGYYDFMQYDGDMAQLLAQVSREKSEPMFKEFEQGVDSCNPN